MQGVNAKDRHHLLSTQVILLRDESIDRLRHRHVDVGARHQGPHVLSWEEYVPADLHHQWGDQPLILQTNVVLAVEVIPATVIKVPLPQHHKAVQDEGNGQTKVKLFILTVVFILCLCL